VGRAALETLARADAFGSLGLDRRRALWTARGMEETALPLFAAADGCEAANEPRVALPATAPGEQVADDYRALRLSLKAHPLALLRDELGGRGFMACGGLERLAHGRPVKVAGLVITRQRPGTAKGVVFITIEDETGIANLIVWPDVFERFRKAGLSAGLLGVHGRVQREGIVIHVPAQKLFDLNPPPWTPGRGRPAARRRTIDHDRLPGLPLMPSLPVASASVPR
jgi:error-prone DNA polymerase